MSSPNAKHVALIILVIGTVGSVIVTASTMMNAYQNKDGVKGTKVSSDGVTLSAKSFESPTLAAWVSLFTTIVLVIGVVLVGKNLKA